MTSYTLLACAGTFMFIALNLWAKSFLIALASIVCAAYVIANLPAANYYLIYVGYALICFNLVYLLTRVEHA